jgi:hypothetical protein
VHFRVFRGLRERGNKFSKHLIIRVQTSHAPAPLAAREFGTI